MYLVFLLSYLLFCEGLWLKFTVEIKLTSLEKTTSLQFEKNRT